MLLSPGILLPSSKNIHQGLFKTPKLPQDVSEWCVCVSFTFTLCELEISDTVEYKASEMMNRFPGSADAL